MSRYQCQNTTDRQAWPIVSELAWLEDEDADSHLCPCPHRALFGTCYKAVRESKKICLLTSKFNNLYQSRPQHCLAKITERFSHRFDHTIYRIKIIKDDSDSICPLPQPFTFCVSMRKTSCVDLCQYWRSRAGTLLVMVTGCKVWLPSPEG